MLSAGEKGAISELKACIWLLALGYEVYRNVTPNGEFDIIAIKDNEIKKIDVTTATYECTINRQKQEKAKKRGGCVVYILPDDTCKWDMEHDKVYEKIKHLCIICENEFLSYEQKRVTCGSIECKKKNAVRNSHKRNV